MQLWGRGGASLVIQTDQGSGEKELGIQGTAQCAGPFLRTISAERGRELAFSGPGHAAAFQIPEAHTEAIGMFTPVVQISLPAVGVTVNAGSLCQGKEP